MTAVVAVTGVTVATVAVAVLVRLGTRPAVSRGGGRADASHSVRPIALESETGAVTLVRATPAPAAVAPRPGRRLRPFGFARPLGSRRRSVLFESGYAVSGRWPPHLPTSGACVSGADLRAKERERERGESRVSKFRLHCAAATELLLPPSHRPSPRTHTTGSRERQKIKRFEF